MQGRFRAVMLALVCAAGVVTSGSVTAEAAPPCGAEPRVLQAFVSGQDIPESVTVDEQGTIYVSNGNNVLFRPAGGAFSVFGTLPLPIAALGVKVGPDGCVYNASTSLSEVEGAYVWRLCEQGSVEVFAELDHAGAPNDLAFDDDGNLLVTDPVLGRIYQIEPDGAVAVLVEHPLLSGDPNNPALVFRPLGVNGIALDARGDNVFVSNTDRGTVLRVPLTGSTHTPVVFKSDARLRGADGVAFDRSGTLYVTVNASDTLVTLDRQARLRVIESGGLLDAPSSVAFGATRHDKHTLYLTSSAFSRTLGLQPGTPQPALLTLRISTPGLPLP